jgi:periplasmic protein CpxP/Spy
MSTSKNRPLIFIISVLLLTNIAVLSYFLWFNKPGKKTGGAPRPPGIEWQLKEEIRFTEDQLAPYRLLREEQMKTIRPMFEEIRRAKDSLFSLIGSVNATDSVVNSVADLIAEKQKAMDLKMFYHFRKIRELCKPDQLEKYDSLVQRMMKKMGRPSHKGQDKKNAK